MFPICVRSLAFVNGRGPGVRLRKRQRLKKPK